MLHICHSVQRKPTQLRSGLLVILLFPQWQTEQVGQCLQNAPCLSLNWVAFNRQTLLVQMIGDFRVPGNNFVLLPHICRQHYQKSITSALLPNMLIFMTFRLFWAQNRFVPEGLNTENEHSLLRGVVLSVREEPGMERSSAPSFHRTSSHVQQPTKELFGVMYDYLPDVLFLIKCRSGSVYAYIAGQLLIKLV